MKNLLRKLFLLDYFAKRRERKQAKINLENRINELRKRDPFIYR
jgi:hypothetical protein